MLQHISDFIHIYDNNAACVGHVLFTLLDCFSLMDVWVVPYFSYYE